MKIKQIEYKVLIRQEIYMLNRFEKV